MMFCSKLLGSNIPSPRTCLGVKISFCIYYFRIKNNVIGQNLVDLLFYVKLASIEFIFIVNL